MVCSSADTLHVPDDEIFRCNGFIRPKLLERGVEDMNTDFRVYRILFPSEMDYINMRMHRFHKVPNHSLNS